MEAGEKLEHVYLLAAQLGSISLAEWKNQLSMHAIPLAGIWCHFLLQPDVGSSDGDKLHWEWERQREGGSCKAAGGRVEWGGDDRDHIMKDNGDSGAIMNVICMWQCDNCDIW